MINSIFYLQLLKIQYIALTSELGNRYLLRLTPTVISIPKLNHLKLTKHFIPHNNSQYVLNIHRGGQTNYLQNLKIHFDS